MDGTVGHLQAHGLLDEQQGALGDQGHVHGGGAHGNDVAAQAVEHADSLGACMIEAGLQLEVGRAGQGAGDHAHDQVADRVGSGLGLGSVRHAREEEEG